MPLPPVTDLESSLPPILAKGLVVEIRTSLNVRYGSKADILRCGSDVLFTPESGHVRRIGSCLLWAKSGLLTHFAFD
jgi:hypothetical protein